MPTKSFHMTGMAPSVMGLLAKIPVLQEGQCSDKSGLNHRLLVEGHEGSLLHGLDVGDDLAKPFIRRPGTVDGTQSGRR